MNNDKLTPGEVDLAKRELEMRKHDPGRELSALAIRYLRSLKDTGRRSANGDPMEISAIYPS